jgi:hypothetical protein
LPEKLVYSLLKIGAEVKVCLLTAYRTPNVRFGGDQWKGNAEKRKIIPIK